MKIVIYPPVARFTLQTTNVEMQKNEVILTN